MWISEKIDIASFRESQLYLLNKRHKIFTFLKLDIVKIKLLSQYTLQFLNVVLLSLALLSIVSRLVIKKFKNENALDRQYFPAHHLSGTFAATGRSFTMLTL